MTSWCNMKPTLALYTKELKGYFYSLSSYIFIIVFLTISSWLFFQNVFLVRQTSMEQFFNILPWFFLFLIPALTMRIWAEEKRLGTYETLLALPLSEWQAVMAKFLASFTFVGVALLFSFPIPFTLARLGNLDFGPVASSYVASWLLAGALLGLGQFISSLTKNQIVAFLITTAIAAFFILLGLPFILTYVGYLSVMFHHLSLISHYENMTKGLLDIRDIFYYLSFIAIFLYLNVYILIRRHWRG